MGILFSRGALTDQLLTLLRDNLPFPVGDGVAPQTGGWTGGQPGSGKFQIYTVLTTGGVTPNNRSPLGDSNDDWMATFTLRGVGSVRGQADWVGDKTRHLLTGQAVPLTVDLDGLWRITRYAYSSLGPVTRNDSTDPAYWEVSDVFAVWLSRSRT